MTQDELWLTKWQEAINFLETNHRKPSKFVPEERNMRSWWKHNKKLMNAGELKVERMEMFKQLLELGERYKHVNQYQWEQWDIWVSWNHFSFTRRKRVDFYLFIILIVALWAAYKPLNAWLVGTMGERMSTVAAFFCWVSLVALLPLCFDCYGNGFVCPQPSAGPLSLPKEHDGYHDSGKRLNSKCWILGLCPGCWAVLLFLNFFSEMG